MIARTTEQRELLPSLERVEQTLGEKPENALADGAYATGPNIVGLEHRGIEFFSNLPSPDPAQNPAIRLDPTQPVPPEQWDQLPISPQTKKLDKACFVYDPQTNTFHCPQGHAMPYEETKSQTSHGEKFVWDVYRCGACDIAYLRFSSTDGTDQYRGREFIGRKSLLTERWVVLDAQVGATANSSI